MDITLVIILFTTTTIAAPVFLGNKPNSGSKNPNKLVGIDCKIIKTCDADTGAAFGAGSVVPKFEGRSGNFDDCEALGNCDVNVNGRNGANESDEACNEDEQTEEPYPYQLDVRFGGARRSRKKNCNTKASTTSRPRATRKPITMATDDGGWGSGSATEAGIVLETKPDPKDTGYVTQGVTYTTAFPTAVADEDVGRITQGATYTTAFSTPVREDVRDVTQGVTNPTTFSTPVTEEDGGFVTQGVTNPTTFSTPVTEEDDGFVTQGVTYTTALPTPVTKEQVISSREPTIVTNSIAITTEMGLIDGMNAGGENVMRPTTVGEFIEDNSEAIVRPSTENGFIAQTTEAVIEETPGDFQQTAIPTELPTTIGPQNNFGFVPGFGNTYRPFVDCYATGTCNSGFNVPGFGDTGCRGGRCGGGQTNFGGFDQYFSNFGNRGQGGNPFGNYYNFAEKYNKDC